MLFVRGRKRKVDTGTYNEFKDHWCTEKESGYEELIFSEEERLAFTRVQAFAKARGLSYSVENLGRLRTRLKFKKFKIRKVPAVLLNGFKIEGVPSIEDMDTLISRKPFSR